MEIRSLLSVCICLVALAALPGCLGKKGTCPDCTPSSEMADNESEFDDAPSAETPASPDDTLPEHIEHTEPNPQEFNNYK